jgi:hypothetical protein
VKALSSPGSKPLPTRDEIKPTLIKAEFQIDEQSVFQKFQLMVQIRVTCQRESSP